MKRRKVAILDDDAKDHRQRISFNARTAASEMVFFKRSRRPPVRLTYADQHVPQEVIFINTEVIEIPIFDKLITGIPQEVLVMCLSFLDIQTMCRTAGVSPAVNSARKDALCFSKTVKIGMHSKRSKEVKVVSEHCKQLRTLILDEGDHPTNQIKMGRIFTNNRRNEMSLDIRSLSIATNRLICHHRVPVHKLPDVIIMCS